MTFRSLTLGIGLVVAGMATAQPVGYATKSVKITAGILVTPQTGASQPYNNVPFVWNNLDKAVGIKPAAWVIDNPTGTGVLTQTAASRWGGGTPGQQIDKTFAPYWEVNLELASETVLNQYDVLLMPVVGVPRLTSSEREKIRRFLDKGGILWVDLTSNVTVTDAINSGPGPFFIENDTTAQLVNTFHPLMRNPNRITVRDLSLVGTFAGSSRRVFPSDLGATSAFTGGLVTESQEWDSVAVSQLSFSGEQNRTIAAQKVGAGFVVLTTRGISAALNEGANELANNAFRALEPGTSERSVAAQKFAVNLIHLAASSPGAGAGNRNSNSVATQVNAPAIKRFDAPTFTNFTGTGTISGDSSDTSTPAVFNGRIISAQGNRVVVYDAVPNRNLDNDPTGNPDDGYVDDIRGSGYDVIWYSAPLGGKLSSPTVIENPQSSIPGVEQVWVRDEQSNVYVFDLNSNDPDGMDVAPIHVVGPPDAATPNNNQVTPVTYFEGLVFVTDTRPDGLGRIWVIDGKTGTRQPSGTSDWGIYSAARFTRPTSAATVGYISIDDSSGGNDKVAYVATGALGETAPGVVSLWLGAKGEAPSSMDVIGGNILRIRTRAASRNLPVASGAAPGSPVAPVIRVIRPDGQFATLAEIATYFSSVNFNSGAPGVIDLTLTGAATGWDWNGSTPSTADDASIRIDYTIDWGQATVSVPSQQFIRGSLTLVDQSPSDRLVVGAPALTPNGYLGVAVSRISDTGPGAGGTLYILKERGRGSFLVRTRFDLYDEISTGFNVKEGTTLTYRESIIDEDNLTVALPFLQGQIRNLRFTGAPAVRNGQMIVTATGQKRLSAFGADADVSVLMSFNAEPGPIQMVLERPANNDLNLKLRQPDMVKSSIQANPALSSTLGVGSFTVEPIPNSSKVRVILDSLANTTNNQINACLVNNLPVMAEWGNSPEIVIEPEGVSNGIVVGGQAGGTFGTLRWYSVFTGFRATGSPKIAGNNVFVTGTSILPELVASGGTVFTQRDGLTYALDYQISPNDLFLNANSVRGWQQQYWGINGATPFNFSNAKPATNFRWPQFVGIRDASDFVVRLLQARIPGPSVFGMAVGEDTVAVSYQAQDGLSRLMAFAQSDFLVVDSGRIARFDPSGNPLWAAERTLFAGINAPVSSARNARPLSEPSRIYPDGNNGFVLVDPGNNMVARLDAAGRETRTISSVKFHPTYRPSGMPQSAPEQLRRPNDVVFWTTTRSSAEVQATFGPETILGGAPDRERWNHWLIADTANNRVIEVIDRYRIEGNVVRGLVQYADPSGDVVSGGNRYATAQGVVVWHTPSEFSGRGYAYTSLYRQVVSDPTSSTGTKTVFALGFNNVEPGLSSVGLDPIPADPSGRENRFGYGGVILFDGDDSFVITEFDLPAIAAGTYIREQGGNYGFNYPQTAQPSREAKVAGLRSVTVKQAFNPLLNENVPAVMLALADGVYELVLDAGTGRWQTRWMLNRDAYVGMRRPNGAGPFSLAQMGGNPRDFRPMYARRLDSDDVLIVNGFTGAYLSNEPFTGEVFMVDGRFDTPLNEPGYNLAKPNLGFNSLSVVFELPPVQGARGIVRPVFAERQ